MLFAAFPDLQVQIDDQVEDGEKVATGETFTGTHKGEFMGIAATGRPVTCNVIDVTGVREGRIVEHSNVIDTLTLLQ